MAGQLNDLTENSMKNLKTLIDSNAILGEAVIADGVKIIPVSRVSFGFGSGGGDLPSQQRELFAGGSGAGVTIVPVAFIIINKNGDVRIQQVQSFTGAADRVVGMVPEVIDKVSGFVDTRRAEKAAGKAAAAKAGEKPAGAPGKEKK